MAAFLFCLLGSQTVAEEDIPKKFDRGKISKEVYVDEPNGFEKAPLRFGVEAKIRLKQVVREVSGCVAEISTSSRQIGVEVEVLAEISPNCYPAAGGYTIGLRSLDEAGQRHSHGHQEKWSSDQSGPVDTLRYYPLQTGKFRSVSIRDNVCVCSENSD